VEEGCRGAGSRHAGIKSHRELQIVSTKIANGGGRLFLSQVESSQYNLMPEGETEQEISEIMQDDPQYITPDLLGKTSDLT